MHPLIIYLFSIIPIFRYFYRFFPISISISISISHFFQYQDQYQYFGFQDFKIKININILENLISRSISRSTWPIYWKILENRYIVPSLLDGRIGWWHQCLESSLHQAIINGSLIIPKQTKVSETVWTTANHLYVFGLARHFHVLAKPFCLPTVWESVPPFFMF